jgi:hypothetical protein
MTVSCSFLLRMRNVSDISCREKQNTHFVFNNIFFFENHAVSEIMWKNIVESNRPQIVIWSMRNGCRIPKATDTQSEYVIPVLLPLQQWLRERISLLHYTYIPWDTQSEYVIPLHLPLQQWLRERISLLHYTYIACLVLYTIQ